MNDEVKAVVFKNFSNEDFVCSWNKVPYKFHAGQETYVEDWKAEHFAKHLIDREINKVGGLTNDQVKRAELHALAIPGTTQITFDEMVDTNARDEVKKSGGRPKKVEEVEFEGLLNNNE